MASISAKYTSATAYTVTVSGMTVGQKYHLFIADLDTSGNVTGYYCRYSQTATSTSYTYNGTCGSAYSAFNRTIRLFCTGTTATSHSVGTKYSTSDFPTSYTENKTAYMTAWSGGSTSSYKILLKLGSGIKSVGIGVNSTTASINATVDTTQTVGSGGYLYLTGIALEDGYSYPVIATDQTSSPYSSWTVISSGGTYSDHYVSAPSSSGTRTVNISATYAPTYYYQIKAHGSGGTFSDGSTYWLSAVLPSSTSYVSYTASKISEPTRSGYTFKGWSTSEGSTTTVDTISFTATSTSSSTPTAKEVWAVWEENTYTGYIKLGSGISSGSVYVDGVLKAAVADSAYHAMTDIAAGATVTVKAIVYASGYGRPFTFRFYGTSAATTPSSTLTVDADEPSYAFANATRPYAELVATKTAIDLFYWDSASTDASLIAKGQPVSNLTAARWNKLLAKIAEVVGAQGSSFSYGSVSSGGTFYATEFNEARTGIAGLTGYGTLPSAQASGDDVLAALFEGSGSLKAALNAAITHFNNS